MSGPWEDYKTTVADDEGPWSEYGGGETPAPKKPGLGERLTSAGAETFSKMRGTAEDVATGKTSGIEGMLRAMGDLAGGAGDVGMEYLKAATPKFAKEFVKKGIAATMNADLGGMVDRAGEGMTFGQTVQEVGKAAERYPNTARNLGALANIAGVAGGTGIGAPVARTAVKGAAEGVGERMVNLGKRSMAADLKIKKNLAQKAHGANIDEKKRQIIDNIEKYNLHSMTGDFSKMSEKADELASQRFRQADEMAAMLSADGPKANPVQVVSSAVDKKKIAAYGKREDAQRIIDKITKEMEEDGLNGELSFDNLIMAKRNLDPDGNLFKLGPAPNDADNLDRSIRKIMYLKLVDKIGEISPDIKALNREGKELLDIKAVASDASSRIMNKDLMGLSDYALGGIGLLEPGSLAASVGAIGVKKSLGQGRGAAAFIKAGRALGAKEKPKAEKTVSDALETPINFESPAFARSGYKPHVRSTPIITDESRLLPPPMLGNATQSFQKPIPSIGDRIRSIGRVDKDVPIVERLGLPSPEDIKRAYPRLSKEDIRQMIFMLNEQRLLPAPMIETNTPKQIFEKAMPSVGDRIRSMGKFESTTPVREITKSKKNIKGESGFIGSKSELETGAFNKFMGKENSPQLESFLKEMKTVEDMRTALESVAPAQRSEMIRRLREMYGEDGWKKYAPLLGTLGMGFGASAGGLAAYGALNK